MLPGMPWQMIALLALCGIGAIWAVHRACRMPTPPPRPCRDEDTKDWPPTAKVEEMTRWQDDGGR